MARPGLKNFTDPGIFFHLQVPLESTWPPKFFEKMSGYDIQPFRDPVFVGMLVYGPFSVKICPDQRKIAIFHVDTMSGLGNKP